MRLPRLRTNRHLVVVVEVVAVATAADVVVLLVDEDAVASEEGTRLLVTSSRVRMMTIFCTVRLPMSTRRRSRRRKI